MKKILITGVTGQDGAYLSRFLIDKNYKVFGAVRRTSSLNYWRLNTVIQNLQVKINLLQEELTSLSKSISELNKQKYDKERDVNKLQRQLYREQMLSAIKEVEFDKNIKT